MGVRTAFGFGGATVQRQTLAFVLSAGLIICPALADIDDPPTQPSEEPTSTPRPVTVPSSNPAPTTPARETKTAPSRLKPKDPKTAPPAASATTPPATNVGTVALGPYVRREQPRDMLVTIDLTVYSDNAGQKQIVKDAHTGKTAEMPVVTPFEVTSMRVLFPLLRTTASSDMLGLVQPWENLASPELGYRGRLSIGETLMDFEPELLDKEAPVTFAAWDYQPTAKASAREVSLKVQFPARTYATVFDERAASAVPWPNTWPKEAQEAMEPQLFVESGINKDKEVENYKPETIEKAVKLFLRDANISDPRSARPVVVAKALTGGVWNTVNISGDGLARRSRTSEIMGLDVQAPGITLSEGKGSPFDTVALLVALLREAGIPARPVIGLDVGGRDDKFLSKGSDKRKLHAWVEFYLFDEAKNTHNWVPIDIVKMRKSTSRAPKFDAVWRGFGTCADMDAYAPFAVAFHPPMKGVDSYGAAGFWGWFVTPASPASAEQVFTFQAGGVPNRGGVVLQPAKPGEERPK